MERQEVYKLVDGERAYQDGKYGNEGADVESWILYMEEWLSIARFEASHSTSKIVALEAVRKVTALGVACMENHKTPPR